MMGEGQILKTQYGSAVVIIQYFLGLGDRAYMKGSLNERMKIKE